MLDVTDTRELCCKVVKADFLQGDIVRVWLQEVGGNSLQFCAGQYVDILLEDGRRRSYSLAAAPTDSQLIELHIRSLAEGGFADELIAKIRAREVLRLWGPLGRGGFEIGGERPVILVAGGTGFAPIKSIIEESIARSETAQLTFYWGVRSKRDLYLHELALAWEREYQWLRYIPVLSEPGTEDGWAGRSGWVHLAVLSDFPDLSRHRVYASGPLPMVHAVRDAFAIAGLPPDQLYSDLL